jgi:hypothetical protein
MNLPRNEVTRSDSNDHVTPEKTICSSSVIRAALQQRAVFVRPVLLKCSIITTGYICQDVVVDGTPFRNFVEIASPSGIPRYVFL